MYFELVSAFVKSTCLSLPCTAVSHMGFLTWALGIELGSTSLHLLHLPNRPAASPQPQRSSSVKQTVLPPSRKWPCSQPQDKEVIIYPRLGLTTAPSCLSSGLAERQPQDGSSLLLVNYSSICPGGGAGGEGGRAQRSGDVCARQAALCTSF